MPPAAVGAPPCCLACPERDASDGVCRLLADPTVENRRRLLTMACDPPRLLSLRFRGQGPDVASEAIVTFLDPAWDPDDLTLSYGRSPRDARIFLGSWPYLYLARSVVRREGRDAARESGSRFEVETAALEDDDPTLRVGLSRALDKVRRIDPVGYAMLLDFLHDRFDAQAWGARLSAAPASVTDRKYLALYRYAVYLHEILEGVRPASAAVALVSRRFSPGDPTEQRALEIARVALTDQTLSLPGWRALYREGALGSLALLGAPEALGPDTMAAVGTAFRRVLRVEMNSPRF